MYDRTRTLFAASREATDGIEFVAATTDESTRGLLEGRFDAGESSLATYVRAFEDYDIPRIVVGENRSFEASESWLRSRGVVVDVLDDPTCKQLMDRMLAERPEIWAEDIGEEA